MIFEINRMRRLKNNKGDIQKYGQGIFPSMVFAISFVNNQ